MAVFDSDLLDKLTGWDQRVQAAASQASDPGLSDRLSAYHQSYWWMDPGAKWSLAKAGIDPTDPTAQTAAASAAHLEVNQGLGFQPVGSPVTKPSGPVDVSSVFATLEQKRAAQTAPVPDASRIAAPTAGPLRQIVSDEDWNRLTPQQQQAVNSVQVAPGQIGADWGNKNPYYTITGWDQLAPDTKATVGDIIKKAIGAGTRMGTHADYWISGNGYYDGDRGEFADQGHSLKVTSFDVLAPLAPLMRPATMISSAPLQEITGEFRNLYQLATQHTTPNFLESQSDLGVAIGRNGLNPANWDTGTGLFVDPNSPVEQERQRRLAERGTIAGHGITVGRALANVVFEPGSKPYALLSGLTDAAFAIKADPTVKGLKLSSEIRAADKLVGAEGSVGAAVRTFRQTGEVTPTLQAFTDAGGLAGIRPTVSKDAANHWLDSQPRLLDALAGETDPYKIYRALNRQADPALAVRLADASTPADVANVLRDELGTTIRNKFSANDVLTQRTSTPSRWVSMMPAAQVDANDLTANVTALERAASLVKAPDDQLHSWFDAMARTQTPTERLAVWDQAMNDTADRLVGKGVGADRAKTLTRLYQDQQTVDRVYAVRAVGDGQGSFGNQLVLGDKPAVVTENQPTMLAQTLDGNIPLPDWRALRKSLSVAAPVLENKGVLGAELLLNAAQGKVWKALQISTVKTMIKVLGDEQLAIAGRGYDSLLNHPISALSTILATPISELPEDAGFIQRLIKMPAAKTLRWGAEHVPGVNPTLTTTATGHDFETLSGMQTAASHGFDTAVDDLGVLHTNDWKTLFRQPGVNDSEFLDAHARNLAQYAASPETRGFARADSLQAAQDSYWNGELAPFRQQLANVGRDGRPELLTRSGSDAYVAKTMDQMQAVTNGNPDLMGAIASGRLDGSSLWAAGTDGTPRVSGNYINKLGGYQDDFPTVTPQQKAIYSADVARRQVADGIFGRAVHTLLGTPSAVLSKSPLFRQAYWERIIDNAPFMTADAQNEALATAQGAANLPRKLLNDLTDAVTSGNTKREAFSGTLSMDQADQIAQGHALDIVRRTTHEFSQRSQAFDMLRLLTPFGEVWRKTIQRWANIVNENPQVLRRVQQGLDVARSPDLGSFLGTPAGQGFFHTDQNGQEVFTVPGSEWATNALTGVPVPLVGQVKGLSLGTEFFPALGPVASIPVAWTMNKLHLLNVDAGPLGTLGETLFPYGPPSNVSDLTNYLPSWMKNAFGANRPTNPDSVRTFNNTVIDYIRYGLTNGDYHLDTPAGIQQAMEDATNKAHALYWIRGAAQFFVPGAPAPQMLLRDKTGKLVDAGVLVQDFKRLSDEDPNTAGQKFLDQYGPNIFEAVTSKSYAYTFGIPTSPDSAKWVDDHANIKRDFPHVFGYFAPPSDPNQFDYNIYLSQLQPGQGRAPLSPEQWAKVANARLAAMQYGKARDRVDQANNGKSPNANQRAWLSQVKRNLMAQYPGYEDALYGGNGLPARSDPKLLTDEANNAATDPTVLSTDAGQGLADYVRVQAKVDAAWTAHNQHASGTWQTSAGDYAISLRTYMRRFAAAIEQDHPQFGPLFEDVYGRAMRDDSNPNALTPGG